MTTTGQFFREKPLDVIPYTTLEFYNPGSGVLRYVLQQYGNLSATLEPTAPRNAGEVVVYEPLGAQASDPEQGKYGASIDIQFGRVGLELKEKMESLSIADRRKKIEVIWRRYFSDSLTLPAEFYYMQAAKVDLDGMNGAIVAQQKSSKGRSPWPVYKDDEFPGMALST